MENGERPDFQLRNAWLSAGLIAIAVLVYWPSTVALWDFWNDDNGHGFIIVGLSAWLLYRERLQLANITPRPSWPAGLLLVGASIAWLVFWRAGVQELHLLLLPVLMGLAVWTAMGFAAALRVAFPIGFLYFAVPAWGVVGGVLRAITVRVCGIVAPLVGIPVTVHDNLLVLPNHIGVFVVEAGCAGVNFFAVGLAVAAFLGELERANLWRRAILMVAMGILALVANWLRVLIIVYAGYTTNMRHILVVHSHYWFGWVLFASVLFAFVWFAARAPASEKFGKTTPGGVRVLGWKTYAATLVALVIMPLTIYSVVQSVDGAAGPLAFAAPVGRGGWSGPVQESERWAPDFVGEHSQWTYAYQGAGGKNVEMVAIGYQAQAQGRELVNEENALFGAHARVDTVAEHTVRLGPEAYIETVVADSQGRRTLVWSVYDIGGRQFVTPFMSQLWYGVRSLGGAPYSVLFAYRVPCESSCDAARDTLRGFAQTMSPAFFESVTRENGKIAAL